MEKDECKLCLKSLPNGTPLGTHMKSNMLNLPIPPKAPPTQVCEESEAASYSSSSTEGEEKQQLYGLKGNPKRSIRLVDPEFFDADSVVLQARESETESSKNPTRRQSKRTWKTLEQYKETRKLKVKTNQPSQTESWEEPEPVSSISDTTNDEDVAFCLMMLSRDQWKIKVDKDDDVEEDTDEPEEYFTTRAKYICETCNRAFNSYQALGGHRASHKKIKAHETELAPPNMGTRSMTEKKTHECPVCYRVFSSGQALGGHKRSHIVTGRVAAAATTQTFVKSSKKLAVNLIDLNLPAPVDDDNDEDDGFLMLK
ncbi:retinoblastoma-binding protein 5-like [Hibiscus syriacus]|uniref:Retinoblastoma-binding protein 5-like n=1 Tax=Hibiscus syriacus TaxID=106335 RepID=A0A6A2Y793_HIBSY|nr:zinc finger protein ZAT9-like [Hibiscus syriacus]KAE8677435.1 retinoblastoma-binding protein 5-like [Hibiscus syriacus]